MKKIFKVLVVGSVAAFGACFSVQQSWADDSSDEKSEKSESNKSNAVIIFKDGTSITQEEISKGVESIPEDISSKMPFKDVKILVGWKLLYEKVILKVAKKSGVDNKKEVKDFIEKRKNTAAGFMLLDEKSKELMTKDELKKHYDKVWDENFKDTKEFNLIAVTVSDKKKADMLKKEVKDLESLKKIADKNSNSIKIKDMESRAEGMFPPEISDAVLKAGKNSLIGPFETKNSYMMFFVKEITLAKKQKFSDEFMENYKGIALNDFMKKYSAILYKKYDVKLFNINGKEIDLSNILDKIKEKNKNKKNEKESNLEISKLSKAKNDFVLATVGKEKVTVEDLKKFFKIDSLVAEEIVAMSKESKMSIPDILIYAVKLVIDDIVLAKEVKAIKYEEKKEVKQKLSDIYDMEIIHAYFKENIKVKPEDVKKSYDKFIKSIPEEDKNDNEISVKLMFFDTQEDASQSLKNITSGEEKFGSLFKEKSKDKNKSTVDLGYVQKRSAAPQLWAILKRGSTGACCKDIIEVDGSQFGIKDKNYAIVYIADRRPVTLPSLSNPQEKKYFQRRAEKEKAIELVKTYLLAEAKTIHGKSIEELVKKQTDHVNRMISMLIGRVL